MENDVEKREGESQFDYHRRLVYGKLVDRTIDLDYNELSHYVYGQDLSSDVARRMMYGSRRTLELLDSNIVEKSDSDMAIELEKKLIENQKETQRMRDQRRELNKLVINTAREEHLFDCLAEAANDLKSSIGQIDFVRHFRPDSIEDNEAVLVFADWHYGMNVSNVFNEFNREICIKRVMYATERAAERIKLHKCRKLYVVVLGDLFHGAIHTSARVASDELVCDQIMQVAEILAQAIEHLRLYVPEICVYCTYGNHGRTIQSKGDSIHHDNMERLIPWWLNERLSEYQDIYVDIQNQDEFIVLDVCGHGICAVHGDNDSVHSAPGILPNIFQNRLGQQIEYILLGDKHHVESYNEAGITATMCGSLCGTDDFANDKRKFSDPSQLLLIMNEENGVDAEYRLHCE